MPSRLPDLLLALRRLPPWTLPIRLLLCGALLFGVRRAEAQELRGSVRAAALLAATPLGEEAWGTANPAAWSTLPRRTFGLGGGAAFGMTTLRHGAVVAALPLRPATVAVAAHTFGFSAYRETRLRVGGARALRLGTTRRLHVGLAASYVHVAAEGYGSAGAVGLSLGTRVAVVPGLYLAAHARNLNAPALRGREPLPQALAVGLALERPGILVTADVYDDVRFPLSVRAGVEAAPVPAVALRVGVASAPARVGLGVGLRTGRLATDVAATRHGVLGWSPSLALSIAW